MPRAFAFTLKNTHFECAVGLSKQKCFLKVKNSIFEKFFKSLLHGQNEFLNTSGGPESGSGPIWDHLSTFGAIWRKKVFSLFFEFFLTVLAYF